MTEVGCEAGRLRTAEPILMVPMGHELVDEEFIDMQFGRIVQSEDGLEKVLEKVFAEFLGRYKNLLAFDHVDPSAIKETLLDHCVAVGHRRVGTLTAAQVFRESFRSPRELKDRIGQNLRESRGRLRLVGEGDEVIPTMKFIAVGDRKTGEWMAAEANGIDSTSGDWQPIEVDDPQTIVFYQQRARISLTGMIADTDTLWQPPRSHQEWARLGSDPILAMAPQPDCSVEEVHACIAMGIAAGVLCKSDGQYEFRAEAGDPILLGNNAEEIIVYFSEHYEQLVKLYSSTVNCSADGLDHPQRTVDWKAQFHACDTDGLLARIGQNALVRMQETMAALMPHLARRPKTSCAELGDAARNDEPLGGRP